MATITDQPRNDTASFGEQRMEGWNGDRLREIRERVGWSQAQMARAAHVSQPNVTRWERGREPSYNNACRIAEALGVNINTFRDDVGDAIRFIGKPGEIDPEPKARKPVVRD